MNLAALSDIVRADNDAARERQDAMLDQFEKLDAAFAAVLGRITPPTPLSALPAVPLCAQAAAPLCSAGGNSKTGHAGGAFSSSEKA